MIRMKKGLTAALVLAALAAQLPMDIDMENYSTNEKIFYPSQKLDTQQTPRAANKVGILAYYEPWGDIVFFL